MWAWSACPPTASLSISGRLGVDAVASDSMVAKRSFDVAAVFEMSVAVVAILFVAEQPNAKTPRKKRKRIPFPNQSLRSSLAHVSFRLKSRQPDAELLKNPIML